MTRRFWLGLALLLGLLLAACSQGPTPTIPPQQDAGLMLPIPPEQACCLRFTYAPLVGAYYFDGWQVPESTYRYRLTGCYYQSGVWK